MKSEKTIFRVVRLGVAAAIGLGFLMFTDPQQLPSVLLVVPFLIGFGVLFMIIYETIGLARRNDRVMGLRLSRPRVLAALLAAFPVLLLVFQSIGQLSIWDIATAVALLIIAYIYVSRSAVTLFR